LFQTVFFLKTKQENNKACFDVLRFYGSKTLAFSGGLKMLDWAWIEADLDARIALHCLR
jgi:hypothetical protein